ncbi:peptidoglycan DD-metalloendopeptidase family protein [bacterium]|nr:peptidoglycan DD-metalloendopeptidase family protein [bacterium]
MNKKILALSLLSLFLLPAEAGTIDLLKQKLAEINKKIFHIRSNLSKTKKQEKYAYQKLIETSRKLNRTEKLIKENQIKIKNLENNINLLSKDIAEKQMKLRKHQQKLENRLCEFYKQGGRGGFLAVFLGVSDTFSILSRSYYMKKVLEEDKALFDEIKREKALLEQQKALLEKERQKALLLKRQQEANKMMLQQEKGKRTALLKEIESKRIEYERALEELERNSREIEQMLLNLEKTPEGQKRLAHPWKGGFIYPVRGQITSGFGMRTHPIYKIRKMHTGIDLSAPSGTPIKASAGGVVVFAGWWGGYGNVVIIDHGGGISTLYGHCSAIYVNKGQNVNQGETIAAVGSTGLATGPHLHFEVRKNGKPVDPMNYL